jgi:hypothetical protein
MALIDHGERQRWGSSSTTSEAETEVDVPPKQSLGGTMDASEHGAQGKERGLIPEDPYSASEEEHDAEPVEDYRMAFLFAFDCDRRDGASHHHVAGGRVHY